MCPKTIKLAVMLFVLSLIAAVISACIDYQNSSEPATRQAVTIIALLFIIFYVILFFFIIKRRNWARIVWLVLFVLGSLPMIFIHHHTYDAEISKHYFSIVKAMLQVLITVLLFLPPSNRWFRRRENLTPMVSD